MKKLSLLFLTILLVIPVCGQDFEPYFDCNIFNVLQSDGQTKTEVMVCREIHYYKDVLGNKKTDSVEVKLTYGVGSETPKKFRRITKRTETVSIYTHGKVKVEFVYNKVLKRVTKRIVTVNGVAKSLNQNQFDLVTAAIKESRKFFKPHPSVNGKTFSYGVSVDDLEKRDKPVLCDNLVWLGNFDFSKFHSF